MTDSPTLEALRRAIAGRLATISDSPDLEARRLIEAIAGISSARLIIDARQPIDAETRTRLNAAVERRLAGEPLAYILGRIGFHDIELEITPDVLVPRPDTETLVEAVLEQLPGEAPLRIADLGTGSGAIALALARARPGWQLLATDAQAAALACAQRNAERLGLSNVVFARGHWFDALGDESFDAIVSNPPYIDARDPHLDDPALRHEPRHALVADAGGLADIEQIAAGAARYLRARAPLLVEHGFAQGEAVRRLFSAAGLGRVETLADLGGRPRVTIGYA